MGQTAIMNPFELKKHDGRYYAIAVSMILAAAIAFFLTPRVEEAGNAVTVDLEGMIPAQFAEWHLEGKVVPLKVDPRLAEMLEATYSKTLTRTYVNNKGAMVMLSIAYGGQQSRSLQVHRPEVCYAAQGFNVGPVKYDVIKVGNSALPVSRLVAQQDTRKEPITYWIRVGAEIARNRFDQMFARYKYGLTGVVPDGVLVRISSVSGDDSAAFSLHERFINDLLPVLAPESKSFLIGTGS